MSYYAHSNGLPANATRGLATIMRAEFDAIAASWLLLPTASQLGSGSSNYFVDTGAANAYVITAGAQVTAYADGQTFLFKAVNANTAASTINVSGLGVKSIVRADDSALQANDIVAGQISQISYNATTTHFQLSSSASALAAAASATAAAASAAAAAVSATAASGSATSAAASLASMNKDGSGGVPGLTLFKLNMVNAAGTITSFQTNANTVQRTYTWPDKSGTVAMTSDIAATATYVLSASSSTLNASYGAFVGNP